MSHKHVKFLECYISIKVATIDIKVATIKVATIHKHVKF